MIALIGSHGVGKTTLLEKLSLITPETPIKDGSSRIVRSFNKEIGETLTPYEQQLLINKISDANWNSDILSNICTTRTPLDHYAYSKALGFEDLAKSREELFENSNYNDIQFFYIPIEFEIESDGIRYEGLEFQRKIDQILVERIEKYNLQVIELRGNIEQRVEKLLKNI